MLELLSMKYYSPYHERQFLFEPHLIKWSGAAPHYDWIPSLINTAGDVGLPATWGLPKHIIEKQNELIIIYSHGMARLVYLGEPFVYRLSLTPNEEGTATVC